MKIKGKDGKENYMGTNKERYEKRRIQQKGNRKKQKRAQRKKELTIHRYNYTFLTLDHFISSALVNSTNKQNKSKQTINKDKQAKSTQTFISNNILNKYRKHKPLDKQ